MNARARKGRHIVRQRRRDRRYGPPAVRFHAAAYGIAAGQSPLDIIAGLRLDDVDHEAGEHLVLGALSGFDLYMVRRMLEGELMRRFADGPGCTPHLLDVSEDVLARRIFEAE